MKPKPSENGLEIELIAVDENAKLVETDDLIYTFSESQAKYQWYSSGGANWNYQRIYQDKPIKKGEIKLDKTNPTTLNLKAEQAKPYVIEIAKKDGTKLARYRIGDEFKNHKDRPDILNITANEKTVTLGKELSLNVNAPFDGEAIVICGLNSVQLKDSVKLTKGHNIVRIPTHENWGTGAYVMISLVRPLNKKIDGIQAKRAVGIHWIKGDQSRHTLDLKLDLPKEITSKTQLKIPVSIENLSDQTTRLMVAVVDEGVMGLTNFMTPDPIAYFFGKRRLGLEMHDSYGYLIDPVEADLMEIRTGGDALALRRGAFVPKQHDKVLSYFDGDVHLDKDGKAEVSLDIPKFSGKLRVYAVAIAKEKMGSQSGNIVVKDDLIVDPALPAFLSVGDETNLNVRFENTSDETIDIELCITPRKALGGGSCGEKIRLEAKQQKQLSIKATAKEIGEGALEIQVSGSGITSGKGIAYSEIAKVDVRSAQQPIFVSQQYQIKAHEKLELKVEEILRDLHSLNAQADLFVTNQGPWNIGKIQKWLIQYPYGCNQQIISKGFAAIFGAAQYKGDPKGAEYLEYQRVSDESIQLLNERQNISGGWGIWARDDYDLNMTAYALEMLTYAQNTGLNVPKILVKNALSFAKNKITQSNWQIRQNRKKADEFAWLVKICAIAEEIDTATTRYCFDEYFDKCETIVAKCALAAAVASIQDLARVEKAMKLMEEDFKKTLSLDQTAAIAGHLAPFRAIKSIDALLIKLDEVLRNALGDDITRLNTQTLALLLKATADGAPDSVKEVKVQIDKKTYTNKQSINCALKPLEDITIQNHGEDSVWVFANACGTPTDITSKKEHGIKVSRHFFKPDGTKIEGDAISLGQRVVVVLEGQVENANHEGYLLLSDWLPSGFTHANTKPSYEWLRDISNNLTLQKRYDRCIASWKQSPNSDTFKIAYEVIPIHLGTFELPGVYVENMINPSQYAAYEQSRIVIKEKAGA